MRDITVTKMEGYAFLFCIPNAYTRNRVINQRLWQIGGQTMFVAKWEPDVVLVKPELTEAPIWLELRNVPYQFFHEEGLEQIAGLVGDPKNLHQATANKTNIEIAKVFTIIDPRKPLPESVLVEFDSGENQRVLVSSPWMPPVCSHCKEIGHSLRHCKLAPITCNECRATTHTEETCKRAKKQGGKKPRYKSRRRSKSTDAPKVQDGQWVAKGFLLSPKTAPHQHQTASFVVKSVGSALGDPNKQSKGDSSKSVYAPKMDLNIMVPSSRSDRSDNSSEPEQESDSNSELGRDSSDVMSSNSEEDEILNKLDKRQQKGLRGKSLRASF